MSYMAKETKLPSTRKLLLSNWRKSGRGLTLKQFARSEQGGTAGENWLLNKSTNTKSPPKNIGNTRRSKSRGQNKK